MKNYNLFIFFTLIFFFSNKSAFAYNLPPVNLGLTSFVDGAPPPKGPGHHIVQYLLQLNSDKFTDANGGYLFGSGAGEDFQLTLSATQYLYLSNKKLLGANWGYDVMQFYIMPSLDYSGTGGPITSANSGLGDTLFGFYLQWDPVMGKKGPKFFHRLELDVLIPTGEYDRTKAINPGSNMVSLSPYYAFTYFINPKWTVSSRIHYLWNSKNDETNLSPFAQTSTAGTAVHANFATSYDIIPRTFRLGLNGYFLKQVTDHEIDGVKVKNAREQVFAIGPGAVYSFGLKTHIFFNAYFESQVENRLKNTSVVLRLTKSL